MDLARFAVQESRFHWVFMFHSQIQSNMHLLITKYDSNLQMMLTGISLAFMQG